MKSSRFIEEQIIGILKQAQAGMKIVDLCRMHGISDVTFYKWRSKYGGLEVSEAKRLRSLEIENRKLKQMLADTILENNVIKDVLSKNGNACRSTGCDFFSARESRIQRTSGVHNSGTLPKQLSLCSKTKER
jgi:putative transposase